MPLSRSLIDEGRSIISRAVLGAAVLACSFASPKSIEKNMQDIYPQDTLGCKILEDRDMREARIRKALEELHNYGIDGQRVLLIDKTHQMAMVWHAASRKDDDVIKAELKKITLEDITRRIYPPYQRLLELRNNTQYNYPIEYMRILNSNMFRKSSADLASFPRLSSTESFEKYGYVYTLLEETLCSTAKIPGPKIRKGDGKTPEGIFCIQSIEKSHDWAFAGKKAYGGYFLRISGSIGIHGNGTDTTLIKHWKNDMQYQEPSPLGPAQGYGRGESHGCIRMDNDYIRKSVDNKKFFRGMRVIIYEDKEMTHALNLQRTYARSAGRIFSRQMNRS